MNSDYQKAKEAGLTDIDRWGEGREHHAESVRMMEFLAAHDDADYGGYFGWKIGGDGDNGETCMFQMDTYFEMKEIGTLRIEPIESELTWHLLNSTITGGKIVECMAAASDDGIGVIACWKMREDGTYQVRALDTEGGWDDNPCDESDGEVSGIPNSPPFKYTR